MELLTDAIHSSLIELVEDCRLAGPGFTPSDFPLINIDQPSLDHIVAQFGPVEDIYPASPMQQGLLFHALYSPLTDLYLNQLSYRIEGRLDILSFKQAWRFVVARHAIWSTAFVWRDLEEPLQVVLKTVALDFDERDWRCFTDEQQAKRLESLILDDRRSAFDLAAPPLARLILIRLSDETFQFIWSHHHLVSDGWSTALILKEVLACYEALSSSLAPAFTRPRPYRDYIAWLKAKSLSEAEKFWSEALKGFASPTPLPAARLGRQAAADQSNSENETIRVSKLSGAELRGFAQSHRVTVNTLIQGAWALLLSRYCGQDDVVFGATTSGRPAELSGIESMVGVFINTLPVRVKLPPRSSVIDWLSDLQDQQAEQRQYEFSPLIQVQRWSALPARQPLFETLVVFENYPTGDRLGQGSLRVTGIRVLEKTHYPLTLMAFVDRALLLQLSFDT
ncbi:MAG: condensation domain-containing protein, partial [Blastocatellia bacterium]